MYKSRVGWEGNHGSNDVFSAEEALALAFLCAQLSLTKLSPTIDTGEDGQGRDEDGDIGHWDGQRRRHGRLLACNAWSI